MRKIHVFLFLFCLILLVSCGTNKPENNNNYGEGQVAKSSIFCFDDKYYSNFEVSYEGNFLNNKSNGNIQIDGNNYYLENHNEKYENDSITQLYLNGYLYSCYGNNNHLLRDYEENKVIDSFNIWISELFNELNKNPSRKEGNNYHTTLGEFDIYISLGMSEKLHINSSDIVFSLENDLLSHLEATHNTEYGEINYSLSFKYNNVKLTKDVLLNYDIKSRDRFDDENDLNVYGFTLSLASDSIDATIGDDYIYIQYFDTEEETDEYIIKNNDYLMNGYELWYIDGQDIMKFFVWKKSLNRIIITNNEELLDVIEYWNNELIGHTHTFDFEYYDEDNHVLIPTCEHTGFEIALPHTFDKGVVIKNLDLIRYTCTLCGYQKTEEYNEQSHCHSYTRKYDENYHWDECDCGDIINRSSHQFDKGKVIQEATEAEDGIIEYKCLYCNYVIYEKIEYQGQEHEHSYSWNYNDNYHWQECSCGDTINYGKHSWDQGKVTKEPTDSEEGIMTHYCTVCGASYEEAYNHTHIYNIWNYSTYYHWQECECGDRTVYVSHNWDSGRITKQATETQEGIKTYYCECGATRTETIPKIEVELPATEGLKYGITQSTNTATVLKGSTINESTIVIAKYYEGVLVTNIGNYAFSDCKMTSIFIPNSIKTIGYDAFDNCKNLTSIVIPDSVTILGSDAFSGCSSLKSVTLSNNLEKIEVGLFEYCTSLTSIEIPSKVTYIDEGAFAGCTNLTYIKFNGTKAQWEKVTKFNYWNYNVPATVVHCSDGDVTIS